MLNLRCTHIFCKIFSTLHHKSRFSMARHKLVVLLISLEKNRIGLSNLSKKPYSGLDIPNHKTMNASVHDMSIFNMLIIDAFDC
jgi:hypothetical protein